MGLSAPTSRANQAEGGTAAVPDVPSLDRTAALCRARLPNRRCRNRVFHRKQPLLPLLARILAREASKCRHIGNGPDHTAPTIGTSGTVFGTSGTF